MLASLEAIGIREVSGFFQELGHDLKDGLRDRLRQAAAIVRDEARAEAPSRRVRSAMTFSVEVDSITDYLARIYPRGKWAFLARFLEHGTKPHPIANFHGHEGEVWLHPGSRPQPFLQPTTEATEDRVVELVGIPPVLR
jgi:HK97 gp10 family phage protein